MRYYFVAYVARQIRGTIFEPGNTVTGNCTAAFPKGPIVFSVVKEKLEESGLADIAITNFIELDVDTYLANKPEDNKGE